MRNHKKTRYKTEIYEQFARIGKAISSPKRLELLDLLSQGARTVEVLAREAGLSVANTSRHLQVLRGARLVESDKKGLYVAYRLADPSVWRFLRSLQSIAGERLADVERIARRLVEGKEGMEPVGRQELFKRVRKGSVTVIDVRPPEEYRAGHIAGAISIPLRELERRISELPSDQEIVAYCRGPYCLLAIQAVETLRARGFKARRYEESIMDWRAGGLPVEVGVDSDE
ncbi:MAG: ArsR family transcriptional regulator [Candidatus Glassbacteria bacterium RBG_16_58_8]|uniref:ArsR family transcriptional regulator n=1 Tax=Candidatus Glassbacteria bacterium RBG_16_58_8 TaxID=1817866 RepID=A0A1F5YAV3_9BACT|nr:MAG: ArsR family transcriptional regulator [Candidatus Glassbacteria bacterium RBG_16_58_8]